MHTSWFPINLDQYSYSLLLKACLQHQSCSARTLQDAQRGSLRIDYFEDAHVQVVCPILTGKSTSKQEPDSLGLQTKVVPPLLSASIYHSINVSPDLCSLPQLHTPCNPKPTLEAVPSPQFSPSSQESCLCHEMQKKKWFSGKKVLFQNINNL